MGYVLRARARARVCVCMCVFLCVSTPQFVGTAIDTVDFKDPQLRKAAKAAGKATARNKAAIALNKKRRDIRLAGGDDASELGDERKGIEGLLGGGSGSDDEDDDASEQIYREYDLKSALVVQRVLWTDEDRRNYEKEQAVRRLHACHTTSILQAMTQACVQALDRIDTKVMNEAKHLLRSKEGKRKVKIEVRVMQCSAHVRSQRAFSDASQSSDPAPTHENPGAAPESGGCGRRSNPGAARCQLQCSRGVCYASGSLRQCMRG